MKLKNANDDHAILCSKSRGPYFGGGAGCDMVVDGSKVHFRPGRSYDQGPLPEGAYTI